ncbi:5-methyltetrahydropteroyltriglutamate--homocysteine S-methyltransferase [bacterium]|nr:5-methyltetrahydropteroyltriglutamate--homocysteine S-methyltransferase [bacterium]
MKNQVRTHNLGFPRIGAKRELKRALESYWAGKSTEGQLLEAARAIRARNWLLQKSLGIDLIPSNDFSLYDHVLDTCALVGAIPERFAQGGGALKLATYFAMARGTATGNGDTASGIRPAAALGMTKWFDTNYHYLVPELREDQTFGLGSNKPFDEFIEARALGVSTMPVLLGPITFLSLSRIGGGGRADPMTLLGSLLPVYETVLQKLAALGAGWVQFDEPVLALDLSNQQLVQVRNCYSTLRAAAPQVKLMLAVYFGDLRDNLPTVASLPVDAIHVDAVRSPDELGRWFRALPATTSLSVGIVDGRNVWKNDLAGSLKWLGRAQQALGNDRLMVSPSCSLLHAPVSLTGETKLDAELKSWLAFAEEKLGEVVTLGRILNGLENTDALATNLELMRSRRDSTRIHFPEVKKRCASVAESDFCRNSPYLERRTSQAVRFKLPPLTTTSIGSFPQTEEVRGKRAEFKRGTLSPADYESFLERQIARCVKWQEETGLDVLVHGEFERNDMVEYFGEQLSGFAFTENGWVQSYGSRCVKPPIIYGDVFRPAPMTVRWSSFALTLTSKPVKGMLTGPVTMLQWSFVRDDQSRAETARQLALAIRDEVRDLEAAGIGMIQIDEPALREGLPLRDSERAAYLEWAVRAFRLASSGVKDDTQIHTHMCYCEFDDILESIAALDADVISIETARSGMALLNAFGRFQYPNEIGPGVWDIHSPRVPSTEEMLDLIRRAAKVIPGDRLWINPDCGLKTRRWAEVEPALKNLVAAAQQARTEL